MLEMLVWGHAHLKDVDQVIREPEEGESSDDDEDEEVSSSLTLEHGAAQPMDDWDIAEQDEGEGQQEAQQSLRQVLKDFMRVTLPVVWITQVDGHTWLIWHHRAVRAKKTWKSKMNEADI